MTSSTRIWSNFSEASKNDKNVPMLAIISMFLPFSDGYVGPPSGKITSYSSREGHKLQSEWSQMKIG